MGGHRFISKDKELVNRVKDVMGSELLVSERLSTIRFMNKNFAYPLSVKDFLSKMNPILSASCLVSYLKSRLVHRLGEKKEETLEEWLVGRYGRKLYEIFFKPYSTKLWGVGPDKISSDWASQRISLLNLSDAILRTVGLKKKKPRTYALKYFYPKKGIGDIFRHLGLELKKLGIEIKLNAEATTVNVKNNRAYSVDYVVGKQKNKIKWKQIK